MRLLIFAEWNGLEKVRRDNPRYSQSIRAYATNTNAKVCKKFHCDYQRNHFVIAFGIRSLGDFQSSPHFDALLSELGKLGAYILIRNNSNNRVYLKRRKGEFLSVTGSGFSCALTSWDTINELHLSEGDCLDLYQFFVDSYSHI